MTGRHRKPASMKPAIVGSTILTSMWVALAFGSVEATPTDTAAFVAPKARHDDAVKFVVQTKLEPPAEPLGLKAVDIAMGKLGAPYIWGDKGPNTFDCSGLTGWVWRQLGVPLGPDTYTQIRQGKRVSDVMPGDLIFPYIGHVQLAVSKTEVIEAPGRGMVVRLYPMPNSYTAIRVA